MVRILHAWLVDGFGNSSDDRPLLSLMRAELDGTDQDVGEWYHYRRVGLHESGPGITDSVAHIRGDACSPKIEIC